MFCVLSVGRIAKRRPAFASQRRHKKPLVPKSPFRPGIDTFRLLAKASFAFPSFETERFMKVTTVAEIFQRDRSHIDQSVP